MTPLVASFISHRDGWRWHGAIYALHPGWSPELVLVCAHAHRSMRQATACAERELARARAEVGA